MVLDRVHRVACATDMVQSQSWEPVPVEAAVKTGKCGWYIVQVLLSAAPAENPQDKVRNTRKIRPWEWSRVFVQEVIVLWSSRVLLYRL